MRHAKIAAAVVLLAAAMIYRRPPLVKYQLDGIFCPERYGVIEATTKSGKTHGAMAWLFERAIIKGGPGRAYWWVAPVYPQAEIAYRRLKLAIPDPLRKANDSALTLVLPNQATMYFKSGEKPDNLYGDDVYDMVIDEASRLREEAWHACRSTLTKTKGDVRVIGNVKGRRNWAYNMARKAQAGEPGMHYAKITAADAVAAGILDPLEVEDARRQLPERVFKELYMAEPSDDGGNPFGLGHISRAVAPMSASVPVCYGIDLAKSVDYTVVIGIDILGRVCRFERFQSPWQETIDRVVAEARNVPALVDSTGVGDPVLEALQRGFRGRFEGYKFTSESKQKLMEGLAIGLQQGRIKIPDGAIKSELESYEYEYTRTGVRYSAPEGQHDDCVCALALAWSHYSGASRRPNAAMSGGNPMVTQSAPEWLG